MVAGPAPSSFLRPPSPRPPCSWTVDWPSPGVKRSGPGRVGDRPLSAVPGAGGPGPVRAGRAGPEAVAGYRLPVPGDSFGAVGAAQGRDKGQGLGPGPPEIYDGSRLRRAGSGEKNQPVAVAVAVVRRGSRAQAPARPGAVRGSGRVERDGGRGGEEGPRRTVQPRPGARARARGGAHTRAGGGRAWARGRGRGASCRGPRGGRAAQGAWGGAARSSTALVTGCRYGTTTHTVPRALRGEGRQGVRRRRTRSSRPHDSSASGPAAGRAPFRGPWTIVGDRRAPATIPDLSEGPTPRDPTPPSNPSYRPSLRAVGGDTARWRSVHTRTHSHRPRARGGGGGCMAPKGEPLPSRGPRGLSSTRAGDVKSVQGFLSGPGGAKVFANANLSPDGRRPHPETEKPPGAGTKTRPRLPRRLEVSELMAHLSYPKQAPTTLIDSLPLLRSRRL